MESCNRMRLGFPSRQFPEIQCKLVLVNVLHSIKSRFVLCHLSNPSWNSVLIPNEQGLIMDYPLPSGHFSLSVLCCYRSSLWSRTRIPLVKNEDLITLSLITHKYTDGQWWAWTHFVNYIFGWNGQVHHLLPPGILAKPIMLEGENVSDIDAMRTDTAEGGPLPRWWGSSFIIQVPRH